MPSFGASESKPFYGFREAVWRRGDETFYGFP